MNEEIKEILNGLSKKASIYKMQINEGMSFNTDEYEANELLNYITNLQEENQKLKSKQVKTFNKIKDHIKACKCEITEGNYCDDKHSNYWQLFKEILEDIKIDLKENDDYVYIPKWREKELLEIEQENQKLVKVIDELLNYIIKKLEEKKYDNDFERYTAYEDILNKLTELKGGDENEDN